MTKVFAVAVLYPKQRNIGINTRVITQATRAKKEIIARICLFFRTGLSSISLSYSLYKVTTKNRDMEKHNDGFAAFPDEFRRQTFLYKSTLPLVPRRLSNLALRIDNMNTV